MTREYARPGQVRIEAVTTTFVASGRPEGVHDLGRLLEALNHPVLSRQLELQNASVRPLYRATARVDLDAPLLVRRGDIIFINFEGPYFTRGRSMPRTIDVPALLMAPPFQLHGSVAVDIDADATQALALAWRAGFFVVRRARVYDADGALLGDGEQIVVNGAIVQMMSATQRHIADVNMTVAARSAAWRTRRDADEAGARPARRLTEPRTSMDAVVKSGR